MCTPTPPRTKRTRMKIAVTTPILLTCLIAGCANANNANQTAPEVTSPPPPSAQEPPIIDEKPEEGKEEAEYVEEEEEVRAAQEAASKVVGLNLEEAQQFADDNGFTIRPVKVDGESYMVTMDYRINRINVVVENGTITEANIG